MEFAIFQANFSWGATRTPKAQGPFWHCTTGT